MTPSMPGIQSFQGQATSVRRFIFNSTATEMLAAAWSTQIVGHASGDNFGLDLTNFPHQQGNLKLKIEF